MDGYARLRGLTFSIEVLLFMRLLSPPCILCRANNVKNYSRTAEREVDTPSSIAISCSRRFLSSNATRVAPPRELIKPMLVPGRTEDCEDALDKGGAMGRSGARVC